MSAPRTKRQFAGAASDPAQRHITSFFTSNCNSASSPSSSQFLDAPTLSDPRSPPLPATVQSNLLSVGMRVRKSVPEGYKTGSYSAFALWDETDSALHAASATMGEGRSRANAISTPRELLPFCGIHKVGGLGTQPPPLSSSTAPYQPLLSVNGLPLNDDDDDDDAMDDDDVPGLTSSQDTVDSTPPNTRKRSHADDDDDEQAPATPDRLRLHTGAWRRNNNAFDFDGEVSPRSLAPAGWSRSRSPGNGNGRAMAVPRKARARGGKLHVPTGFGGGARAPDQENVRVFEANGDDFGEASFLDRKWGAGDWEVEMSDA